MRSEIGNDLISCLPFGKMRRPRGPRMSRVPFLYCADCKKRMLLPVPSPEKTSTDRPRWPTGTWSATVLHLGCEHLFYCTGQDVHWQSPTRITDPNLWGRKRPAGVHEWRRLRLACEEPHCTAQTILFVFLSSPSTTQKIRSTIFGQPRVWRCPAGHLVSYGKFEQEEALSLEESDHQEFLTKPPRTDGG